MRHGHARDGLTSPTYTSWENMISRCYNTNNPQYSDYGGRGITVCPGWRDFKNFLADMGERPYGLTLDRIDNDGNYELGNCKWSTRSEQQRNRRCGYRKDGKPALKSEVAADLGISGAGLLYRKRTGLPLISGPIAGWRVTSRARYVEHAGYVPIHLKDYAAKIGITFKAASYRAKCGKLKTVRYQDLTDYQRQMVLSCL